MPVRVGISFKVLLFVYKPFMVCLLNTSMTSYTPINLPCPSSQLIGMLLTVPSARFNLRGDWAFCVFAPILWNNFSLTFKSAPSIWSFKTRLFTHWHLSVSLVFVFPVLFSAMILFTHPLISIFFLFLYLFLFPCLFIHSIFCTELWVVFFFF